MRISSVLVLLTVAILAGPVDAAGGVKLRLKLDRKRYAPGEFVEVLVSAVNTGSGTAKIGKPSSGLRIRAVDLTLVSPSGREYRHSEMKDQGLEVPVPAGKPVYLLGLTLRLSNDQEGFTPGPPPLRDSGRWKIRLSRPGPVASDTVAFEVRPLPKGKIRESPTPEQRAALERVRKTYPRYDREDMDLLRDALLKTENKGLADHLIDAVQKGRPGDGTGLLRMLEWRAASRPRGWHGGHRAGIDGPYLSRFADLVLDAWEADPESARLNSFRGPSYLNAVVSWIKLHPEDGKRRERLVALARRAAKIRMLEKPDPKLRGRRWTSDGPFGPEYAWAFLMDLGVLRPGMTVEEAEKILGKASQRPGRPSGTVYVRWYLASPRHVNPCLNAEAKDGKIVRFRRTNA